MRDTEHGVEDILSEGCPWETVNPAVLMYFELYRHYANGHLLEDGALNDQPAWYVNAMSTIEGELKQNESETLKRAKDDKI